jgi:hypothetical protein
MFESVENPISSIILQKGFRFLSSPLFALCHFAFRASRKERYGLTKFCAMYHFSQQKKPKKNMMEMVVSKSKKDITFSTAGFLLRMPII